MTVPQKHLEDSIRLLTGLLLSAISQAQYGNMKLASELGLSIQILRQIHLLAPIELHNVVSEYVKNIQISQLMRIDASVFESSIEHLHRQSKTDEMIRNYILLGATKSMMRELFSLHSTQYTSLRRLFNPPEYNNRALTRTLEEQNSIYKAWLDTIHTADRLDRIYTVSMDTSLPISKVYREIKEIERISNSKLNPSKRTTALA